VSKEKCRYFVALINFASY